MKQDIKQYTESLEEEALRIEKAAEIEEAIQAEDEERFSSFEDKKIRLIPSPNFTNLKSIGTLLPNNMANETVTNLSLLARKFDFVEFIKDKLGYSSRLKVAECFDSEQVDALIMAITSFEKDNAFILGDMAGIGKGRVCAGVLRYAYMNGFIPVFLTHKPYLFSDIYRDLIDIGGLGLKNNKPVLPEPFILHPQGEIKQRLNNEAVVVASPLGETKTLDICKDVTALAEAGRIKLPKEFNCVFLPYSVISMTKKNIKQNFLEAIAPKSIFIFDESHNAASAKAESNILKRALPLVNRSKAVLFSSATYAKTPQVFNLYVVRTALRTAVPSLESITNALKVGGENVSEYIASGLVKEGQMIRRVRSFGDCKKITEFVGRKIELDQFGQSIYTDLEGDKQKQFYNEAIGYFKELRDFTKTDLSKSAIKNAILRKISDMGFSLVDMEEYDNTKSLPEDTPNRDAIQRQFIATNRNKFVLASYNEDSITRYKQTFRENLFLAIKGKFAADKIIECLRTPVEYKNIDGNTYSAPMKPVVAVRNTGEAIFNELRLQEGDSISNDFSTYLKAIYKKLFAGAFVLRKVNNSVFDSKRDLLALGTWNDNWEEVNEYNVEDVDFADGGVQIRGIQQRLANYQSELPFSVIDYMKNIIESEPRPALYYLPDGSPKYGKADSPFFTFSEGTSRNFMLVKEGALWVFKKNDRVRDTTKIFMDFNSGATDVMLINQVASTGGSAQSNPKEGVDTRPRNMFIVQFELDINTEVQKRGRVNRTGQINSPTYTYIISQIPVELRTYLMFRKKLRKLDANTSADQSASSENSEINDFDGKPIEDIFNEYGFFVFSNDFINLPNNQKYKNVFDGIKFRNTKKVLDGAEEVENNLVQFNQFTNELELYKTSPRDEDDDEVNQEYFFNEMNKKYIDYKSQLVANNEFQLELEAKNYKAVLKQRVVVQLNSGSTVFSLPLFMTDYYTLDEKMMLSKVKMEEKANSLAVNEQGERIDKNEFYTNFIEDYSLEFDKQLADFTNIYNQSRPKLQDFPTEEEFVVAANKHQSKFTEKEMEMKAKFIEINKLLLYYKPMTRVSFGGHLGYFIGYKITKGGKHKYSNDNIKFIFCFLSKYPVYFLKPSIEDQLILLKNIIYQTRDAYSSAFYQPNTVLIGVNSSDNATALSNLNQKIAESNQSNIDKVEAWNPNMDRRIIKRFYSGNILSGIVEANKIKNTDERIQRERTDEDRANATSMLSYSSIVERTVKGWALTRFSEINGSFETAIEIKYDFELPAGTVIDKDSTNLVVASDNSRFINYIEELPVAADVLYRISSRTDIDLNLVIWNLSTDKVIDRGICIFKREINGRKIIKVQIMQPYKVSKDGSIVKYQQVNSKGQPSTRYNKIYYDRDLLNNYSSNLISDTEKSILYAVIYKKEDTTKKKSVGLEDIAEIEIPSEVVGKTGSGKKAKDVTRTYAEYNVFLKEYQFDIEIEEEKEKLTSLFNDLYRKYETSFNFRGNADLYFFIEDQPDTFSPEMSSKNIQSYPDGQYEYVFEQPVMESEVVSIPNMIDRTFDSAYGGVVLEQPISPVLLLSYKLIPKSIPNDILVKLTFSSLSEEEKGIFGKTLERIADKTEDEIGEYVESYLSNISVPIRYFFGQLTMDEYGMIFKEFALKKDLAAIVFQPKADIQQQPTRQRKSKVTFTDAENFLMLLR